MTERHETHVVAAAALEEFARTGDLPVSARLAGIVDLDVARVKKIAPDEAHLRALCQRFLVEQAAEMAAGVPNFDRFTMQERLGTFVFILLDVLEQNARFVEATYPSPLTGPLNPFEGAVRKVLPSILDAPDLPPVNRMGVTSVPSAAAAANGIGWLIRAWISDDSEEKQRSTALIDRSISLMAASMTNPVPQRGVDLVRYGVEAGYLPLSRIPVIGGWFSSASGDRTNAAAAGDEDRSAAGAEEGFPAQDDETEHSGARDAGESEQVGPDEWE